MQAAQNLRALFLGGPAETGECGLGCGNGAPRIFLVGKRDAADYLTVGRLDYVHDFAAVRFNECPIDVVCGDCSHCLSPFKATALSERMRRVVLSARNR